MAEQGAVQSVERSFMLIELLCKNGAMGITEMAVASGLNKTTVFRLVTTLVRLGYAEQKRGSDRYRLTMKFLRLSADTLSGIDMRRYARPYLEHISQLTGETVHLVERSGNSIVYIDKFDCATNSIRMVSRVGLSLPMVYTAVGRAIMARLSDEEVRRIWDSTVIEKKTPHTITDFAVFAREIARIRQRGYAVDQEENELGVRCVGTALPDMYGNYEYAFSVSAPANRMDEATEDKIGKLVMEAGRKLGNAADG